MNRRCPLDLAVGDEGFGQATGLAHCRRPFVTMRNEAEQQLFGGIELLAADEAG